MTEILLVNLVKLINSRRSKFDFHASFHLYTEFESINLNFKRSHQIIFKFNFCIRLEESLERRVRAETSSIEAAIAKAEDPASSLSVNLTNQISKSLQVQLQNEMKKDWLPFFYPRKYAILSPLEHRLYYVGEFSGFCLRCVMKKYTPSLPQSRIQTKLSIRT